MATIPLFTEMAERCDFMFREMRRKKQKLSQEEAYAILERGTSGVLGLLGDEGYPYTIPLSYGLEDHKIYFHCALEGHKIDAIHHCDKASFCVIDQDEVHPDEFNTYFRSVIAFGRIRIISDEEEKKAALHSLGLRYNPDENAVVAEMDKTLARTTMLEFTIEHITAKSSLALLHS